MEIKRNSWTAKMKRTVTSVLPVADNRVGGCIACGKCCALPNVCPFLNFNEDGKSSCKIYAIRPLNCRKYPRNETEQLNGESCGYKFE